MLSGPRPCRMRACREYLCTHLRGAPVKHFIRKICQSTLLFGLLSLPATAQVHDPRALIADPASATAPIAPRLTGLGDHHIPVTTESADSQYFFDQGYRLTMGFNHSEALRSFKEAVRLDPSNAMAYWGWALALGPNLNLPMQDSVVAEAHAAISKAMALRGNVTDLERGFIEALAARYSPAPLADRSHLDAAYADAMKKLSAAFPNDLDAATLYAAALMNTNPWDYWYRDGSPKPHTVEIMRVLRSVVARDPSHAGAHHYLIHTVEAFRPELGVESADILGDLLPGAGHLVHMPSHIYMRVGRYKDSFDANVAATEADESYITQCRSQGMYPLTYYPHNLHFMVWSAMFQGRSAVALDAARKTAAAIPEYEKNNTWAINETFRSQPMFVMVRFGMWDQVLAEPMPRADQRFMQGVWHYARGLAQLAKGDSAAANEELVKLRALRENAEKDDAYYLGFGAAGRLLHIAELILEGEMAAKAGDHNGAIALLDTAVRVEDSLLYNEPPDWYFPVRHVLGAMLMDAGRPAEAEVVYWEDLRRNPENGYSLFGLEKSLAAQGNDAVRAAVAERFKTAWGDADTELTSSRY